MPVLLPRADFEADIIPIEEVVFRIVGMLEEMRALWSSAHGWAPDRAAASLSRSRLDRQVSLAQCLHRWLPESNGAEMTEGELILAWANLGSVVEGSLKTLLCVHLEDFASDPEAPQDRRGVIDPDRLSLERLRQFLVKRDLLREHDDFIEEVQQRRNAIHAFKHREIGSTADFEAALRQGLKMLADLDEYLPTPDLANMGFSPV